MFDASCSNLGFNIADLAVVLLAGWSIWFVFHQFKIGESYGRGSFSGVKRSRHPRRFKFMIACYILLAVVFTLVAIMDVYARIHHLPRC